MHRIGYNYQTSTEIPAAPNPATTLPMMDAIELGAAVPLSLPRK